MSENTNFSSSPTNPKMSPGLAKAIAEGTLKFPEGQLEPTFFHCAVDDCGYKSYGEFIPAKSFFQERSKFESNFLHPGYRSKRNQNLDNVGKY